MGKGSWNYGWSSSSSSSSSEDDDRNFTNFEKALHNEEDRGAETYKKSLAQHGFLRPCFYCNVGLPDWSTACGTCNYEFHFCKKCWDERTIVVGSGTCIFCLRKLTASIKERIFPDTPLPRLKEDETGVQTLLKLLAPKQPLRKSNRIAAKKKQ